MSPSRRIRAVYRRALTIEEEAARAQLRLLRDMRRSLLGLIAESSGFRLFHLNQVLGAIDQEIVRGRALAQRAAQGAIERAFGSGHDLLEPVLRIVSRQPVGLAGVSFDLMNAAIEVTNDQVRGIWGELGSRLKSAVRRVTIGITDPFDAVREVAKIIRNPKTFGTAQARAEAIVRTEVNRTFSLSSFKSLEDAEKAGVEVTKGWLPAGDGRVREAHRAAGARYGEGAGIPVKQPFIVGGEPLMFPGDPRGSAENTINCRCRLWPMVA